MLVYIVIKTKVLILKLHGCKNMKLEYKIMFIDDKMSRMRSIKTSIAECNKEVGINTNFNESIEYKPGARENLDEYKEKVLSKLSEDKINDLDMILVDLNLHENVDGTEVLKQIRVENKIYVPLVFYSDGTWREDGNSDLKNEIYKKIKQNGLQGDGVFIREKNELNSFVVKFLKRKHSEEHKVNRARGLLMDRTSEFDAIVINILKTKKWVSKIGTSSGSKRHIRSEFKRLFQDYIEYKEEHNIENIHKQFLGKKPLGSWSNRCKFLHAILTKTQIPNTKKVLFKKVYDIQKPNRSYKDIRNDYAHKTEVDLTKLYHNNGTTLPYKNIRKITYEQMNNINNIYDYIMS